MMCPRARKLGKIPKCLKNDRNTKTKMMNMKIKEPFFNLAIGFRSLGVHKNWVLSDRKLSLSVANIT
jgi:hypothetical protein